MGRNAKSYVNGYSANGGDTMALAGIQRINVNEADIATGSEKAIVTGGNGKLKHDSMEQRFSPLSPDLAQKAVWVAEQLRASLESNVVLERTQEVLNLVFGRYKLLCRHIKMLVPPEIEQDFFKTVVDEILGFGPLEPLQLLTSASPSRVLCNLQVRFRGAFLKTDEETTKGDDE